MGVTMYEKGMYVPIRSSEPCPICGKKTGRCSRFYYNDKLEHIACKHVVSDEPSGLPGWYIHRINDKANYHIKEKEKNYIPDISTYIVDEEILKLRNNVYRDLQALIKKHIPSGLYKEDKEDLIRRGLNDKEIESLGCFSVPKSSQKVSSDDGSYKMQLSTYISNKLFDKYGNNLLKVAGFNKYNGKNGDYITFRTKMANPKTNKLQDIRGYFIPYINYKNQFVGMQYRLSEPRLDEKGKPIRYFWFSSRDASSGSPIDYIVPNQIVKDNILLLGEGALKMKIACLNLELKGMAEAGVTNYFALVTDLQMLEIKERKKYNIIVAYDMDKYTVKQKMPKGEEVYPVLEAESKLIDLLKTTCHKVAIAEWDINLGKGIDDALMNGAKISYNIV